MPTKLYREATEVHNLEQEFDEENVKGPAQFLLPNGTISDVTHALYAPRGNRTLLSFKDIRANGYHAEMHDENGKEFLCIPLMTAAEKRILEKFMCISSGLYSTTIRAIESNNVHSG
ncbi:hypothetical protein M0R45_000961 [Rubus argutus]|uniref:Uncharacterized protein n=1 Tax=Rubus argutus TaxID=59490 RepID=A0AAW1VN94_RUBAR